MTSTNESGAGAPNTDPAEKIRQPHTPQDRPERNAHPEITVVTATRYRASGSAANDWAVVSPCPECGGAHRHVWFEHASAVIERSPSCAPHRTYLIKVANVVPARRERRAA